MSVVENQVTENRLVDESDYPEGWAAVRIGDVFDVNPPKVPGDFLQPGAPVTFVPMPAVDAERGALTSPQERLFSEVRKGFTSFVDDDVIFARITPCMENGKAAIVRHLLNGVGFGSTEFHVLRSTGTALPEYVYHYIRQESFRRLAESEMTGSVGQRRVPADFVKDADIPLPPLAEQMRIAEKVEQLLKQVNAARERLTKVPAILKAFRQSVLATACSGRLTADWREENPDVVPAEQLLARLLTKRQGTSLASGRKPFLPDDHLLSEMPDTWAGCSTDQLTTLVTSGSRGWAKYYSDSGPLFIRSQDISTDALLLQDVARVNVTTTAEGQRTRVHRGDMLLTITGANVSKCALVTIDLPEAYVSQHVGLLRLVDQGVGPYLHMWLTCSKLGRAQLLDAAYGAGKPGLNLDNIRRTTVGLPPMAEQHEIVRRVDSLFALADSIEQRVAAATRRAEKLTQAMLAKAFRGELVPTEAELARKEGRDYEPASVLLERICTTARATRPRGAPQR